MTALSERLLPVIAVSAQDFGMAALSILVFLGLILPAVVVLLYLIYFLLTLPMRRNERARLVLDFLEMGLRDGRTPETALTWAAASNDGSLGGRFHRLATHLGQGLRLSEALAREPRLLPPQVTAMLKAGERIGDIGKTLPACRRLLKDGVSQVRGALNYVVMLSFILTPFALSVPFLLYVLVLPRLRETFGELTEHADWPAIARFAFGGDFNLAVAQAGLAVLVWLATLAYIGGPRLRGWFRSVLPLATDDLLWLLPWRRKRLQRDFSAMLAVLLDAEVPEAEAVIMAAEATDNLRVVCRAARVRDQLKGGVKLPEAIRAIDNSDELHWRLSNALRQTKGFLRALAGWHEALDARAFQLEQTAAQVATTLVVLINGLVVAGVVIGVFALLVEIINQSALW
jgi:type II secretory pathway component PulF